MHERDSEASVAEVSAVVVPCKQVLIDHNSMKMNIIEVDISFLKTYGDIFNHVRCFLFETANAVCPFFFNSS